MTVIENILRDNGPLMSSELSKILEKKENIGYNTASQRVARNRKIKKIKGFFISNQSLCYLPAHVDEGVLFDTLMKVMYEFGKKYWFCLNAIKLHGGIIRRNYLESYTNYPIKPLKSHIPFNKVMKRFVDEEILIFNDDYYLFSPKLIKQNVNNISHKTIEIIKEDILNNFNNLTKNTGLISYNTGEFFGEFGKYRWAFKGVSNISGLFNNKKHGFLLADIIIGIPIYEKDVLFFVEKLKQIQSFNNASKILPFLIVDDLDLDALKILKKNGIAIGFIKELFGQKYADTLKDLVSVLNNAGASLKSTPDKYLDLIKELKKYNEGLVNNIRGTLFEFVVGHIHSVDSNSSINLGREITENNSRHEIDVLASYSDKIIFAECKATKSEIDIDAIDKWLSKKIPAFKKWFEKQETWSKKQIEFEYWSISGFTDDALKKLEEVSSSVKKYKITYFQSTDIRDRAKQMNNKKLKEALDDFFLKPKV